jgi:hypothetical protein
MMRGARLVVAVAVTLAGLGTPAWAGGKRLPKPVSTVDSRPASMHRHHATRDQSGLASAGRGVIQHDRGYRLTHAVREMAPSR